MRNRHPSIARLVAVLVCAACTDAPDVNHHTTALDPCVEFSKHVLLHAPGHTDVRLINKLRNTVTATGRVRIFASPSRSPRFR